MQNHKSNKLWIQSALGTKRRRKGLGPHHIKSLRVEPEHKGALHRQLGIPEDEVIPVSVLRKTAKKPGILGKRARLALTLRGFSKRR